MLAAALAHDGVKDFQADHKELMLLALCAISPTDLRNLNHDYLKGGYRLPDKSNVAQSFS
jgi:hypothetical protein